ncbi:MAG: glycosyltransferase family 4 protein [Bacteroidetes bacterium]|nr:glycosyltransferase family 4 protein [Bacteroidota bacterium]
MKILQICNKPPYPPHEGGSIAMHAVTQGLIDKGHSVKVLAINSLKNKINFDAMPDSYVKATGFESVFVDLSIKIIPAFFNLFSSSSYHVKRFISTDLEEKIIEILRAEKFDIIQLETLYLTPYISCIRLYSEAKIILRAHNVEHLIWERIAEETKNPFKKLYLRHLAKTLKKYEVTTLLQCDGIAAITSIDANQFLKLGYNNALIDIPFGINLNDYRYENIKNTTSLFHIGSMNWLPNVHGIQWFLDQVWIPYHKDFNHLKLYLAGRKMPQSFIESAYPDVIIEGEVADAKTFMQSKSVMIVPLFSGSGIRIKIIEAMAMGKIVIATKIAAEGINYSPNENIIIADTAKDFKAAILDINENREKQIFIGANARQLIEREYDNNVIIDKLIQFYRDLIKKAE